jgi:hypothetical protein
MQQIYIRIDSEEKAEALTRVLVYAHNIAVENAAEVRLPRAVIVDLRECMATLGDKLEARLA